jgi:hypothetical protein
MEAKAEICGLGAFILLAVLVSTKKLPPVAFLFACQAILLPPGKQVSAG